MLCVPRPHEAPSLNPKEAVRKYLWGIDFGCLMHQLIVRYLYNRLSTKASSSNVSLRATKPHHTIEVVIVHAVL